MSLDRDVCLTALRTVLTKYDMHLRCSTHESSIRGFGIYAYCREHDVPIKVTSTRVLIAGDCFDVEIECDAEQRAFVTALGKCLRDFGFEISFTNQGVNIIEWGIWIGDRWHVINQGGAVTVPKIDAAFGGHNDT